LRRECVNKYEGQLRFLNTEIDGLITHIANATDANWAASNDIREWLAESETAKKKAIAAITDNLFGIAKSSLFVVAHWRHPAPDAGRVKTAFINFGRVIGFGVRKYEMSNPRFLKYAKRVLEGLKAEQDFKDASSWDDYIHASGDLAKAMAELAGGYTKRLVGIGPLITIGRADYDIWKADLYAYWVAVMAKYRVKRDEEISAQELKNMALWSGMLHTEMTEKRRLLAQLNDCVPKLGN
jgi:hypothetical protein